MTDNQLWEVKYQPHTLDEIVAHSIIVNGEEQSENYKLVQLFKNYVKTRFIPNITLGGSSGIGKTLLILCFAHDLELIDWDKDGNVFVIQPGQFQMLNASDTRGIDMVRSTLKNLSQKPTLDGEPRLIFLDEGDEITPDAQGAMRGLIEQCPDNARFILTGNYPENFLDAINSRCPLKLVQPLTKDDVIVMIKRIQDKEKFTITQDAIDTLFDTTKGDMRLLIKRLQEAHIASNGTIQKQHISQSNVDLETVKKIIEVALNDFVMAKEVTMTIYNSTKDAKALLQKMFEAVDKVPLCQNLENNEIMQRMLREKISDIDFRLSQGTNAVIQLSSLINYIGLMKFIPLQCPKVK